MLIHTTRSREYRSKRFHFVTKVAFTSFRSAQRKLSDANKFTICLAVVGALAFSVTTASANPVKVILLGGQSNAVGQGNNAGLPTSPVNLQLPQDDILFYYTGGTGLTTLRPGSGGEPVTTGNKFGVEVTFGREIADADPSVTYAIIKHAESGTALYNDWAPGTGSSYAGFRSTVDAGLAALQNAGYTTEIVGMLWHQGESDALEEQEANYENNLTAFIADIRSRYGANLPFFIGEIRRNGGAHGFPLNRVLGRVHRDEARNALDRVVDEFVVFVTRLEQDDARFGRKMLPIEFNLFDVFVSRDRPERAVFALGAVVDRRFAA